MAPYQHPVMTTKTSADSKPTSQTKSTGDSTLVNLALHEAETKDGFDKFFRVILHRPNAIQKPLIQAHTELNNLKQADPKVSVWETTCWENCEEAFEFYNRGGPALRQMLSQRKRLPQQSISRTQHSIIAPSSKPVSDLSRKEAFKFYNRGGQALQQTLDHTGRTPRQSGFKGPLSTTVKRDVDAKSTVSKHALGIAPHSEDHILLHNGTSLRIPEIEIQGFKRVMSSPKVVNIAEEIPTHLTNARYEMNQGNITVLNNTIDGQAAVNQSPAWKGLEVFGLVLLGIVVLAILMSSVGVRFYKRKGQGKKKHEAEVIEMERLARLQRIKIGVEDLGDVIYSVDLNEV